MRIQISATRRDVLHAVAQLTHEDEDEDRDRDRAGTAMVSSVTLGFSCRASASTCEATLLLVNSTNRRDCLASMGTTDGVGSDGQEGAQESMTERRRAVLPAPGNLDDNW